MTNCASIDGRVARCVVCGNSFSPPEWHWWNYRMCSKECKRKRNTDAHRKYCEKNMERVQNYNREKFMMRNHLWGSLGNRNNKVRSKIIEDFAESKLPESGFLDIMRINDKNSFFTGDFIATKDNSNYLIEVTSAYTHPAEFHIQLCKRLGIKLAFMFVKPDMSKFILKEIDSNCSTKTIRLSEEEIRNA